MTAAKIRIDNEGRVQTDAATLETLKNREFELQADGQIVSLTPRPRRLHEIEDVGERMAAFDHFVASIARTTGVSWPADYDVRDDIYD
ncbi:hypothetical protein [Deinococcus marmoris]|uniref:hypothetical protein n=1 Tax=Deinococcus marmoris TaxID=249408 RepID=UPI000495BFD5|nr:hypothetical protein [Deinococcus marmoris]